MEQIVSESLVPESLRLCGSVCQSLTDDKIVQIIFFKKVRLQTENHLLKVGDFAERVE
jgi:hypothetical protein